MPSQLFGVTDLNPSQEHFVSIRMQTWQPAHGPITARCDGEVACAHAQCAQKKTENTFPHCALSCGGDMRRLFSAVCEWGEFSFTFLHVACVREVLDSSLSHLARNDHVSPKFGTCIPRLPCAAYMIW